MFFRGFNAAYEPLERRYVRVIRFMVERSHVMATIALVLIGLAIWGLTKVPTGFIPTEDQGSLGLAVASGMLASTCLAVLFVPAFFVFIRGWAERRQASRPAAQALESAPPDSAV